MKHFATWALIGALFTPATADAAEEAQAEPPIVHYTGSRKSTDWISLPNGTRVAVDKGVTWQGVRVHLTLTWQLVGVDAKSGAVLFHPSVGAFWNGITFKQVTPKDSTKRWAIELRPGARWRADGHMRQYHDLRTGAKLEIPHLVTTPSGTKFKPRLHWHGGKSDVAEKFMLLVTTPKSWATLRERLFAAEDNPPLEAIDFEKEVVLALSSGNSSNCRGITFAEGYEDDDRILVRVERSSFQTMNGYEKTRPWGLFVLPRRPKKAIEVERNAQGLIGGPPLWRQIVKFHTLGTAEKELAQLPAKSDVPHHGWSEDVPSRLPPPPPPKKPK